MEIFLQFFKDNAVFTTLFILDIVGIIGVAAAMAVVKIRSRGKVDDTTNTEISSEQS